MAKKNIYYCIGCGKTHSKNSFYKSYNPDHKNGVYPFCKEYIKNNVYTKNKKINIDKLKNLLMQMDAPFLISELEGAIKEKRETIGAYFSRIAMPQNRKYTWKNSIFKHSDGSNNTINETTADNNNNIIDKTAKDLTQEEIFKLEDKWGYGYTLEEYILFEKKWDKLIDNYGRKTAMHVEGLKTYIRFRVKEELATAKGSVKEAKDWGQLASKAADDAKINVKQLSKSDISGGIDVMAQLFEAVESEVGIIPLLPKVLEQPYDDVDIIIWCITNYIRRLEGKSRVEYRDVWNFYDKMLEEYCEQQGMNEDEIEKFKEKRRVPYRDLGKIYREPVYEDGDI